MTKEEIAYKETNGIFNEHELGITGLVNAMEIYAKQESIAFLLWFVGQLKFPSNVMSYTEDSTEGVLLNLPATINNRYNKYLEYKSK